MVIDLKKLQKENKQLKKKDSKDNRKGLEKLVPHPKKFLLEQNRATIVLKNKEPEPIRSLFFKEEFIKERDKDLKFLS